MNRDSPPALRVLHATRLLGFADVDEIAARADVPSHTAQEHLRNAEEAGWIQRLAFADVAGCSLTDAGRAENERHLAAELREADPAHRVAGAYRRFLPLNTSLVSAVTAWQIRPIASDPFAANDHGDAAWDARVLAELAELGAELAPLTTELIAVLTRFAGYAERFCTALNRAVAGEGEWVDRTDRDSCHRVWFQLHEDLIATLGLERGR